MVKEKVGREDWRSLNVGETGVFTLPTERALESARVSMSMVKRLDGYDFERVDVATDAMTIAYKRIK